MEVTMLLSELTNDLQEEMTEVMGKLKKTHPKTNCSYGELLHIYYMMKFAEMQLEINKLKTR